VRLGLAFCSEDRKAEGILPNLSVRENLLVALQGKRGALRASPEAEQEQLCEHYIKALRIRTADAETPIKNLSGGNQQKVLLARWLATQPAVIILDEPTRGIDIGAKQEIEQLIAKLRERRPRGAVHLVGDRRGRAQLLARARAARAAADRRNRRRRHQCRWRT
jgi:monosaccharide-transporting ATPase